MYFCDSNQHLQLNIYYPKTPGCCFDMLRAPYVMMMQNQTRLAFFPNCSTMAPPPQPITVNSPHAYFFINSSFSTVLTNAWVKKCTHVLFCFFFPFFFFFFFLSAFSRTSSSSVSSSQVSSS